MLNKDTQAQETLKKQFKQDGILILTNFFSTNEMRSVRALLDQYLAEEPSREPTTSAEYVRRFETEVKSWHTTDEPAVQGIMTHPRLTAITEALLGSQFVAPRSMSFATPRGCGQGWHQDSGSDEEGQFVLNRILFCHNIQPEQGELYYVPGSYKQGHLPSGGNHEPLPGQMHVAPTAGTMVLMHSRCYHRVALNQTDSPRIQVNSRARSVNARADLTNFAVFRNSTWNHQAARPW
ncbi:phytanoyl-CoA dioxygenase family protein [Chloroflexi bacterium TSY]|nr:phytanoyl-CoA dioxygenase family protein [Chloroflexi bacterium TSY]